MDEINNPYFVHEDDWGMIPIILEQEPPAERADTEEAFKGARLTMDDVAAAFGMSLHYTDSLETGRTTAMEPVDYGFVFYHDLIGAVYGLQEGGMVRQLWFDNRLCDCEHDFTGFINGLHRIGTRYGLMLIDKWLDLRIPLSNRQRIETYIEEE